MEKGGGSFNTFSKKKSPRFPKKSILSKTGEGGKIEGKKEDQFFVYVVGKVDSRERAKGGC